MNWGKGLAITLFLFMSMILYFVYRSTQQDFDLVTKDYYEEALKFDDVQLKRSNYNSLGLPVVVTLNNDSKTMSIALPDTFSNETISGFVHLYRPTNGDADVKIPLVSDSINIPTDQLISGLWHIKVDWDANNKSYMFESSTFINN